MPAMRSVMDDAFLLTVPRGADNTDVVLLVPYNHGIVHLFSFQKYARCPSCSLVSPLYSPLTISLEQHCYICVQRL